MKTHILLTDPESACIDALNICFIGRRARLDEEEIRDLLPDEVQDLYDPMLESLEADDKGVMASTWLPGRKRFFLGLLPENCSRYNSKSRAYALTALIRDLPDSNVTAIIIAPDSNEDVAAQVLAVARAYPELSFKHRKEEDDSPSRVRVAFALPDGSEPDYEALEPLIDGIRLATRLTDTPTNRLSVSSMIDLARGVAKDYGAQIEVLEGESLFNAGFEGIYSVGKASVDAPAFVHLTYIPKNVENPPTVAWVGKGVVFDSGGLQIKSRENMTTMKTDMAGAAVCLAAFAAAIQRQCKVKLHALLCLAENAVGPNALRPDDVITLYSGKTVEINNTDAEGRLLLGDGVAYAARHLNPDLIVSIATLTGAQLVATGKRISAVISNDEQFEQKAVAAGKKWCDLAHPLPWAPEFYRGEFSSKIADMKNSVKDRQNAQTSCAAWFVASHLCDYRGPFVHLDVAGPALDADRATGAGFGLLLGLLESL